MKEYIIRLKPQSSSEVSLHSDTLFGAVCWGIRILFGEDKLLDILECFKTEPPFILSSAFPCRIEKKDYYLPKPVLRPLRTEELKSKVLYYDSVKKTYHSGKLSLIKAVENYKEFNKVVWIDYDSFLKLLRAPSEEALFTDYMEGYLDSPDFAANETVQKNSLDRLSNSTTGSGNTFYADERFFNKGWGLYFLLRTDRFEELLLPVLKYLEDSGIGRNAATGKNRFSIDWEERSLFDRQDGNSFISLSRYIKNEPLNIACSSYKTIPVRSKVESREEFAGEDVWKSRVAYLCEGSVCCPEVKKDFYGGLFPVKEISGKRIYQYGYAYPVWVNTEVDNGV